MIALRSLRYRNYRLFFTGQALSLFGSWMTPIAVNWLTYRLTQSSAILGLVNFAGQIPVLIFSAFAGVWLDRWRLQRVLIILQVLSMLQSFALAFFAFTNSMTIPILVGLAFVQGVINAFDMPARQSFVIHMVENKRDIGNAVALNSFVVNVMRFLGPAVAGILIAKFGERWCFLIDGFSYNAAIIALCLMRISLVPQKPKNEGLWQQLKEGSRYAFDFLPIRVVLIYLAMFSFFGFSFNLLLPVYADEVYQSGATSYGSMMAAVGLGALLGALGMSNRKTILGLGKIMMLAGSLLATGLILFSFVKIWLLSLFILGIMGLGYIVLILSVNTFLQNVVDDHLRGRIMGLYSLSFVGVLPIGNLFTGALAKIISAPWMLFINGVICLFCVILFGKQLPKLKELVHRVYKQKNILPMID